MPPVCTGAVGVTGTSQGLRSILPAGQTAGFHPERTWYLLVKAIVEWVVAGVILVITAPVILLAAVLVKLTSPGPAFYSQKRLGRHCTIYTIHKIRTMIHGCESRTGPRWSTLGDPQITPIGRYLRRTHLDELPQLWNVLRGDMSLIGPRPERPEFLPTLEREIPRYRERLRVRPGITGLAQVQLPADTGLRSVRRKLAYDLYYVRKMGPWLDLRILGCTLFKVAGVPFPLLRQIFRMPRRRVVEGVFQGRTA